jgi:hypothetical protein
LNKKKGKKIIDLSSSQVNPKVLPAQGNKNCGLKK